MPYPHPNEKKDAYISRCMGNEEMKDKHPDVKNRLAVCYAFWKEKKPKKEGICPDCQAK